MNFEDINVSEVNATEESIVSLQSDIIFDGYSLQNINFITSRIDYDDLTTVELNKFNFPRADGGGVLSKYYRGRTIKLEGYIKADTQTDFLTLIDEVKKNTRATEGYLEITINGEVRQIKATVTDLSYSRDHYNITMSPISITFTAQEAFFYSKTPQSLSLFWKTATFTEEMTHLWGAEAQPDVYFVFGAWTSVTAVSFTDPTGRILTVTTALADTDVIIIDSENKKVYKNSVETDYTWAFPIFSPWANNFTCTFTWTVLVDTTLVLPKNYL